jgi:hypothetical protein
METKETLLLHFVYARMDILIMAIHLTALHVLSSVTLVQEIKIIAPNVKITLTEYLPLLFVPAILDFTKIKITLFALLAPFNALPVKITPLTVFLVKV